MPRIPACLTAVSPLIRLP